MIILKISRLEGLTDGVFAIAMTILVLDLRLTPGLPFPQLTSVLLTTVMEKLFIYAGSFIILGTLWIAMNFQLGLLRRINRPYLWANVFYLMTICVVPFSASLVAEYPRSAASISFFALNLLCASAGQLLVFQCAHYFDLNNSLMYTPSIRSVIVKRILLAPIFYIISLLIAHINPSLAFVILIAPILIYIFPGTVDQFNTD